MNVNVEGLAPLLQVYDMPGSLRFYRDGLGFEVVARSEPGDDCNWAMLRLGDATIMLNTLYEPGTRPPEPDLARNEVHADTILYFGCRDLDGCYQTLATMGAPVDPPKDAPYGMRQVYAKDPDGYALCFQWPTEERRE